MKYWLILFLLICGVASAEQVKLEFNVSGGNCKHIYIKNNSGRILEVTHEKEIFKEIDQSDSTIIKQIKREIRKKNIKPNEIGKLKTEIEKEEFYLE